MCILVASNNLELPYYKGIGRQKGRGFGAFAQVIGRTAIHSSRKYIVSAAKRLGAELLEFAVPEAADVLGGKEHFKTAAKSVGSQILRKQLGGDRKKSCISVKNLKRSSRSRTDIFTKIAN